MAGEDPNSLPDEQQQQQQQQQKQQQQEQGMKKKNLNFMGHDKASVDKLPDFIKVQLPYYHTTKGAIDTTLLAMIKSLVVSGVAFSAIMSRLKELQCRRYF
jgi:hypothetical protein